MPRYAILGVEGPQDKFFVAEVLKRNGFTSFNGDQNNLDIFWKPFIPAWPTNGKLHVRPEFPTIVHKADVSVALCAGEGSNLLNKFPALFTNRPQYKTDVVAFGIIADADTQDCVITAQQYAAAYRPHFPFFPDVPGIVDQSGVRTGIYLLPNNVNNGTLETVLLECGNLSYPDLMAKARSFIAGIDRTLLTTDEKKELLKFAGENKALVGCVSSVLRPGLTVEDSIRKDRWLEVGALALPRVQELKKFLCELIQF